MEGAIQFIALFHLMTPQIGFYGHLQKVKPFLYNRNAFVEIYLMYKTFSKFVLKFTSNFSQGNKVFKKF